MELAYYIIIAILLIGGAIGWSLFFYSVAQTFISRRREMNLILEIRKDLERVKEDISVFKINR